MKQVLKKIFVGMVNVSLCMGLLSVGASATATPQQEERAQTLTVSHYEIDGEVLIDEETVFRVTPDGNLLDTKGRAVAPRFKLLRRVSVGLTNDGSLSEPSHSLKMEMRQKVNFVFAVRVEAIGYRKKPEDIPLNHQKLT